MKRIKIDWTKIFIVISAIFGVIAGIIYAPIYFAALILLTITRLILALCYVFMFRWRMAVDIVKNLFK